MSTVPEIFIASILRMKTLAISLISNMASGISPAKLSHTEIAETIGKGNEIFSKYMENLILSIK
jgi:purine-nucleoside phosphorylase